MTVPVGITFCGEAKILPYEDALRAVGIEPVRLRAEDARSLDGLYGLVLTGGTDINPRRYGQEKADETGDPDDPRDEMEMRLVGEALALDLPLLAICRGMQLLNVHLHGTLQQHLGSPSIHVQRLRDDVPGRHRSVHNVNVKPGTLLERIARATVIPVNSRHHQAIGQCGPGVIPSGISDDAIVEAIEYPARRFVLGVQWHPEDRIQISTPDKAIFEAFAAEL